MLKVLIPAVAVLAVVFMVDIPKEWLPGKNARQLRQEQEKAAAAKAEAARKAADAVAVRRWDDPEGVYHVDFPGTPGSHNIAPNSPFPNMFSVAGKSHTVRLDGLEYESRYERWRFDLPNTKQKLATVTPRFLTGPGLAAPSVIPITARGTIKGVEASGVYQDRPRRVRMIRRYLVPEQDGIDRVYSVSVEGPADWLPNPEAEAFLDSFAFADTALVFPLPGAPGAVLKN